MINTIVVQSIDLFLSGFMLKWVVGAGQYTYNIYISNNKIYI